MKKNKILSTRIKILILIVLIFLIGLIMLSIFQSRKFQVVSTNPSISQLYIISPSLEIDFNQNIKSVNISSNTLAILSYGINKNKLLINFRLPLNSKQKYTISLSRVTSSSNQSLYNISYSFTPIFKVNNLPASQSQRLLEGQAQYNKINNNNQLIQMLPFTSPNGLFEVSYTNFNNNFNLIITAQNNSYQQLAISWLESQGINASYYRIQYINNVPQ